jgi:hypothetical protein
MTHTKCAPGGPPLISGWPDINFDHSQALENDATKVKIVAANASGHILGRLTERSTLHTTTCVSRLMMTALLIRIHIAALETPHPRCALLAEASVDDTYAAGFTLCRHRRGNQEPRCVG